MINAVMVAQARRDLFDQWRARADGTVAHEHMRRERPALVAERPDMQIMHVTYP